MRIFSSWHKYIIIGVIVVAGVAGVYAWKTKSSQEILSPGGTEVSNSAPIAEGMVTWTDEAGFSFQYPKVLVTNKHEEDNQNYAHVELTHKNHPGNIIIWVKDLPKGVTDVASWVKLEKAFAGGTVIDSTLGGEPAKKIIVGDLLTVGTVSENLLFSVEATMTDKEYWSGVFDSVSTSFAFVTEESSSSQQGAPGGADVDEEEVVE